MEAVGSKGLHMTIEHLLGLHFKIRKIGLQMPHMAESYYDANRAMFTK